MFKFLSTPSGWRATAVALDTTLTQEGISIHALRVEGDKGLEKICKILSISIHALRVEGDLLLVGAAASASISIHALRVEGDCGF